MADPTVIQLDRMAMDILADEYPNGGVAIVLGDGTDNEITRVLRRGGVNGEWLAEVGYDKRNGQFYRVSRSYTEAS